MRKSIMELYRSRFVVVGYRNCKCRSACKSPGVITLDGVRSTELCKRSMYVTRRHMSGTVGWGVHVCGRQRL